MLNGDELDMPHRPRSFISYERAQSEVVVLIAPPFLLVHARLKTIEGRLTEDGCILMEVVPDAQQALVHRLIEYPHL